MTVTWIVFFIEGIISLAFKSLISENSFIFSSIIMLINFIVYSFDVAKKKYSKYLVLGYTFRLALLVWDCRFSSIFQLPNSGQDTMTYHLSAVSGIQSGNWGRGGIYSKTVAVIYRLFGIQMPIAQYVNVLLAMSMILVFIKIINELELNEKQKDFSVKVLCFLPNLAIINSILLRETVVMFMVSAALLYFVRWYKTNRLKELLFSICFGLIGALYHSGAIAIVLGAMIIYILFNPREKKFMLSSSRICMAVVLIVAFVIINSIYGDAFLSKFGGIDSAEDIISSSRSRVDGGSAYTVGFNIGNATLNLIVNTPIRMLYFLGAPMPWDWRGLNDIIAFTLDSVVFIYAIYIAIAELKNNNDDQSKHEILIFLILALTGAAVFAWGVSNAGTALRHREKFISIYVILIAICRQKQDMRKLHQGE